MPDVRYVTPGIPQGAAAGLTAFLPHFNRQCGSGAQSYKYALRGFPGTRGIPAPIPGGVPQHEGAAMAQQGRATSSDAPPEWFPQQYYQSYIAEQPGAGMPILRVNPVNPAQATVLPVPASTYNYRSYQYRSKRPAGIVQRVKQIPVFARLYNAPAGQ